MITNIYIIILCYFLLGTIGIIIINKRKEKKFAKNNWIKIATYFLIINAIFFSIILGPPLFIYITPAIALGGLWELIKLYKESGYHKTGFFTGSLILYFFLSYGFILFSGLERELILFVFLILSIFDSFSQISGQLWGKKRLMPKISPNKTWMGLIGGTVISLLSGILIKDLIGVSLIRSLLISAVVIIAAFGGDAASSFYKRKYNTKDFSRLIPAHGGILDRFDSLIAAGAIVALIEMVIGITLV